MFHFFLTHRATAFAKGVKDTIDDEHGDNGECAIKP